MTKSGLHFTLEHENLWKSDSICDLLIRSQLQCYSIILNNSIKKFEKGTKLKENIHKPSKARYESQSIWQTRRIQN